MLNLRLNPNLNYINTTEYKSQFPGITDLEIAILQLKKEGNTYNQIQSLTGNPSKKIIRETLLKYSPNLLNNLPQPKTNNVTPKKRIIGLIKKFNRYNFNLDEFGESIFSINNSNLSWTTWDNENWDFDIFDERTQLSILYNIARLLNIDIKENEYR